MNGAELERKIAQYASGDKSSFDYIYECTSKTVYFAALFVLPSLWGAEATFYAEAISDVVGPLTSIAIHALVMKKILARRAMQSA